MIYHKINSKCYNHEKGLLQTHLLWVKKWLKLKEKTHLIQPYVAFICPQYMLKLLAIDMSCGAFDEFIWCVLEMMSKICKTYKSPL